MGREIGMYCYLTAVKLKMGGVLTHNLRNRLVITCIIKKYYIAIVSATVTPAT